jgi:hypothetical protein
MSRLFGQRREIYGLCLGILLSANLVSGAAVVVARASGPDAADAADDPIAGMVEGPGLTSCGQGSATAQAVLDRTPTGYVLRATVANDSNRVVELDRLVVEAVYPDGARTFDAGATAHWISAGVPQTSFAIPASASPTPPSSFSVADFGFHSAGRPDCIAR